jgi:hypothetical protein
MLKDVIEITDYRNGDLELEDILEIYKIDDITIYYSTHYNEYMFDNWYHIKDENIHFKEVEFDFEIVKGLLKPKR